MFDSYPKYNYNRTMTIEDPAFKLLATEDVWALQKALQEMGFNVGMPDGWLGPKTDKGIRECQKNLFLTVDGKAGPKTQRSIALTLAGPVASTYGVPPEAMEGQIEWESAGFKLGAYSPQRPDGSYDAGITQRNTKETPPQEGFDPVLSIRALAKRVRDHHTLFEGVGGHRRRWVLAQMSWNAPAFACYIAKEEGATKVKTSQTLRPSSESRTKIEEYGEHVSKYLTL